MPPPTPTPEQFPGCPGFVRKHEKFSSVRSPHRWRRHHHVQPPRTPPLPPPPPHNRHLQRENNRNSHFRPAKSGENHRQSRSSSYGKERKAATVIQKYNSPHSLEPSTATSSSSTSISAVQNEAPITAVGSLKDWSLTKHLTPKKPRLGWGDGLANYEKKKLETATNFNPANLTHYLNRLLQAHDPNSITTLIQLKAQIIQAIEETESQIDSLETQLNSLPSTMVDQRVGGEDDIVYNDYIAHIYDSVLASDKDSVKRASDELNKSLPAKPCVLTACCTAAVSAQVKERFLARRRIQKFNEKATFLKFKVFNRFWKEGRIVSIWKLRNIYDQRSSMWKKNRILGRSQVSSAGESRRIVPVEEVVDFINELLLESRYKFRPCRDTPKMPALMLDRRIKVPRFIPNNSLVGDPCAVEKERSMINPWTAEERDLFIDKLSVYGKDFAKISSFIEHKTVADCIEFYYKNHKSEWFECVRKKLKSAKQNYTRYMVVAGDRQNHEVNGDDAAVPGSPLSLRAKTNDILEETQYSKCAYRTVSRAVPVSDFPSPDTYNYQNVPYDDMSSCTITSFDRTDGCQKLSLGILTTDTTLGDADDEYSDVSCEEMESTNWSDEEKLAFVQAVSSHGKDFEIISQVIRTRSKEQCKLYFSKIRKSLELDQIHPSAANCSDDGNEDGVFVHVFEGGMGEDHRHYGLEVSCASGIKETQISSPHVKICGESSSSWPIGSLTVDSILDDNCQVDDDPAMESKEGALGHQSELEVRALVPSKSIQVENVHGTSTGDESGQGDGEVFPPEYIPGVGEKVEDIDTNSVNFAVDPQLVGKSPNRVETGCQNEVDDKAVSAGKSVVMPPHQNDQFASVYSSLPFSTMKQCHEDSTGNAGVSEMSEKQSQGIPSSIDRWDEHPIYLHLDRILRKYPALVQTVKEIKHRNVNSENRGLLTRSQQQREIVQKSSFQPLEQSSSNDGSKPQTGSAIKLFGKVIISNSSQQATSSDGSSQQSRNLKCDGDQGTYMDHSSSKFGASITQVRFPPFLDSTQVLTKYPPTFSNQNHYNIPLAKLNQQQLQQSQIMQGSLWNNNYHQMNTTTYTQLTTASNYLTLRKRELQQRHHAAFLSEMQRRNRIYVMPSNQTSGMVLGNYNTAGGFASGILDPVTAMKMQHAYSQVQSFRTQARNAFEEPRSNEKANR